MAQFTGNFRSHTLGMDTQLCVILPHDRPGEHAGRPPRVLYLLHGLGDNASSWQRYSPVEWLVREQGIAVIMPEVQRSFYTDMVYGQDYFHYITEELPELCAAMFGISTRREDTCIAGLSMGGFGALKCALSRPDRYAACGSFSGAVDIPALLRDHGDGHEREMVAVLGENGQAAAEQDLGELAARTAKLPRELRPYLYMTCGTGDFLLEMNRRLRDKLSALPLQFEYAEWEGEHNWRFWNASIELAIDKFFGNFAH